MKKALLHTLLIATATLVLAGCNKTELCSPIGHKPRELALQEWTSGANAGDPQCQYYLGLHYMVLDYTQASHWLKLSFDNGVMDASLPLAVVYSANNNPQRDLSLSEYYASIAVEKGASSTKAMAAPFLAQTKLRIASDSALKLVTAINYKTRLDTKRATKRHPIIKMINRKSFPIHCLIG